GYSPNYSSKATNIVMVQNRAIKAFYIRIRSSFIDHLNISNYFNETLQICKIFTH
ncbi:uncharacterized protein METZ01_LOCUS470987, partial [marine metagenome]